MFDSRPIFYANGWAKVPNVTVPVQWYVDKTSGKKALNNSHKKLSLIFRQETYRLYEKVN